MLYDDKLSIMLNINRLQTVHLDFMHMELIITG